MHDSDVDTTVKDYAIDITIDVAGLIDVSTIDSRHETFLWARITGKECSMVLTMDEYGSEVVEEVTIYVVGDLIDLMDDGKIVMG